MNPIKTKPASEFPHRYLTSLRLHLVPRQAGRATSARSMGREALAAGCDAFALARMHEQAVGALTATHDFADAGNGRLRRAGRFLADALIPLERDRRATRESLERWQQQAETLRRRTAALAASNRLLRREVSRREAAETSMRKVKERYRLLLAHSRLMQKKLRHIARQILVAQESERRKISRELHDEVVQTLVGINVELAALGRASDLGARALKAKIAHTQRLVEKSVGAVHQFARDLRPAVLDDLGLIPALHAYLKTVASQTGLKLRLTAAAQVESLDKSRRTVLYRVAQEALTNVARHAQATQVDMHISEIPGFIRMEVHDNGKSFQVLPTLAANNNKRLGLLGMRERVEMVGGTLTIESAPGLGTTVRADLPFRRTPPA